MRHREKGNETRATNHSLHAEKQQLHPNADWHASAWLKNACRARGQRDKRRPHADWMPPFPHWLFFNTGPLVIMYLHAAKAGNCQRENILNNGVVTQRVNRHPFSSLRVDFTLQTCICMGTDSSLDITCLAATVGWFSTFLDRRVSLSF